MDIRNFIIKMSKAELTYKQLKGMLSPEELERLYDSGMAENKLPAKPMLRPLIKGTMKTVKPVLTSIPKIVSFLRTGYGNSPGISSPQELNFG